MTAEEAGPTDVGIGTLNENPLHAAIKQWLALDGDPFEVEVDGYLIDLIQGDELVEVQTANFGAIRTKLLTLLDHHRVRLVYPVAKSKWIVKIDEAGAVIARRKSPRSGSLLSLFSELVSIPDLCAHQRLTLAVLLVDEEEIRQYVGRGWRKRGWRTVERRLLAVKSYHIFDTPEQIAALLPDSIVEPFGTAELATELSVSRRLAQQMAYCLRRMEMIEVVGKAGNAHLYRRC